MTRYPPEAPACDLAAASAAATCAVAGGGFARRRGGIEGRSTFGEFPYRCSSAILAMACASACSFASAPRCRAESRLSSCPTAPRRCASFPPREPALGLRGLPAVVSRGGEARLGPSSPPLAPLSLRAAAWAAAPGFGWNSSGWVVNRRHIGWRHDHPHAHRGLVEQAFGEGEWQPDVHLGRRPAPPAGRTESSAMPDQVMRCMCGMKASSYRFE